MWNTHLGFKVLNCSCGIDYSRQSRAFPTYAWLAASFAWNTEYLMTLESVCQVSVSIKCFYCFLLLLFVLGFFFEAYSHSFVLYFWQLFLLPWKIELLYQIPYNPQAKNSFCLVLYQKKKVGQPKSRKSHSNFFSELITVKF